jgi:type I restriction-modification system DNA methylase subunit
MLTSRERVSAFVREMGENMITLCAEHIQPITVCDPSVGSGVMLLAAAEQTPRWALNWGLVQFYGQDIDQACVTMCRINVLLYGLNGFNLKTALELSQAEIAALPEPYASQYAAAQANPERIPEIAAELREYKQAALL